MKRVIIVATLLSLFIIQAGCKSDGGGVDPKKRQERISIPVESSLRARDKESILRTCTPDIHSAFRALPSS
jgi:hypothetical protein